MRCLIDTSIALRPVDVDSPQHLMGKAALGRLALRDDQVSLVPRVFYELWAVMTRSVDGNGLGWTPELAQSVIDGLTSQFLFLADMPAMFDHWLSLVSIHQVSGKQAHGAGLAAAMQVHNLDSLITFNGPDFRRSGVQMISPADFSQGGPTV